ncbi:MAG: DUF4136 domain-containing protein [Cyclobacteriaceae bacterium]
MKQVLIFALLITTACSGLKVRTITKPGVEMNSYRSFCWIDGCEDRFSGPEYAIDREKMQTIRKAIHSELVAAGLVNDQNNPDLLIGFRVNVDEKEVLRENNLPTEEDNLDSYPNESISVNGHSYKFLEGSLIIDLIDSNEGSTVCQISLKKYMDLKDELTKEDLSKYLRKAFEKLGLYQSTED